MAATLADSVQDMTNAQIQAALELVRPAGLVATLLESELQGRFEDSWLAEDGSDAYVRMLEDWGYEDARAQEAFDARYRR